MHDQGLLSFVNVRRDKSVYHARGAYQSTISRIFSPFSAYFYNGNSTNYYYTNSLPVSRVVTLTVTEKGPASVVTADTLHSYV